MTYKMFVLALLCSVAFLQPRTSKTNKISEYPAASIREQQEIAVDGATEVWRLEWKGPVKPYCGANETSMAITCPCQGFAYGESGDLYLTRRRDGKEIDRLHLTPLFEGTDAGTAALQRWVTNEKDFKSTEEDITPLVSKRPVAKIMDFGDYDHNGSSTEFYLQLEAEPCGKSMGVVVGVSASNPRLHVFSTVSSPSKPLSLFKWEWQALRTTSSKAVQVMDWRCGDHGADTQTEVWLQWSTKGIEGKRREYTCPSGHEVRRLIKETTL